MAPQSRTRFHSATRGGGEGATVTFVCIVVTSLPGGLRGIAMSMSVCLSVRSHISKTTRPNFTKFSCMLPLSVARSFPGGVAMHYVLLPVLWMTSCFNYTSGSMVRRVYSKLRERITAETTGSISTKFCSATKNSKYTSWFSHRGELYHL